MKKSLQFELLRYLDELYNAEYAIHRREAPTGGSIPVGGGEWMDSFFRCEALRGCMTALRNGDALEKAIEDGKTVSSIAVELWNTRRRDYQVHRDKKTAHDFLETKVRIFMQRQPEFQIHQQISRLESKIDQLITAYAAQSRCNDS